jgi:RNA polymerase sigma factor (sigma-70 family)
MIFNPAEIRTLIHMATKRTGTPVHDEDLEQDIAVRAWEAFQRQNDVKYPRALLMKIVCDSVRDYWRRKRPMESGTEIDETLFSHVPAFELNLDREKRTLQLRRALERLPVEKRLLLELFYVRDHSIPEIAAIQGRSVSAIKMDLARSRTMLKKILSSLMNSRGNAR